MVTGLLVRREVEAGETAAHEATVGVLTNLLTSRRLLKTLVYIWEQEHKLFTTNEPDLRVRVTSKAKACVRNRVIFFEEGGLYETFSSA